MPHAQCEKCTKKFWGSSARSAQVALNRHVREVHKRGGKAKAPRRKDAINVKSRRSARISWVGVGQPPLPPAPGSQGGGGASADPRNPRRPPTVYVYGVFSVFFQADERRRAHQRRRAAKRASEQSQAASVAQALMGSILCFILCPKRREDSESMFSDTRAHLSDSLGLDPSRIHRVQGIDLLHPPSKCRGQRLEHVKAHQCCMAAFHRMVLPRAVEAFHADVGLRFVLFLEDDARLVKGLGAADVHEALGSASRATAVWCGYHSLNRWPVFGAHALAISRSSCQRLIDRTEWEYQNEGYYGLDTYLSYLWWQGLVHAPAKKIFVQRRHKLEFRQ